MPIMYTFQTKRGIINYHVKCIGAKAKGCLVLHLVEVRKSLKQEWLFAKIPLKSKAKVLLPSYSDPPVWPFLNVGKSFYNHQRYTLMSSNLNKRLFTVKYH